MLLATGDCMPCRFPVQCATPGTGTIRFWRMHTQVMERRLSAWGLPSGGAKRSKPMWPAERVVFLNDVYFCARDVVRHSLSPAPVTAGLTACGDAGCSYDPRQQHAHVCYGAARDAGSGSACTAITCPYPMGLSGDTV